LRVMPLTLHMVVFPSLSGLPRALYADTDSVVYSSKSGEWKLELGVYLGDLTDEVPDNRIIEFVTVVPRTVFLHDDSFVKDYPVVFVLMYSK
jgi:hypothetical protein